MSWRIPSKLEHISELHWRYDALYYLLMFHMATLAGQSMQGQMAGEARP
jgi:hypothetical protein